MRRWLLVAGLGLACSKRDVPPPASNAAPPATAAAPTDAPACPQTGTWAECSVVYRLERAGLAPKIDSTAKPAEQALGGTPLMLKIGLSARLEVHLFPDSAARLSASSKLDRRDFVSGTSPQTIRRERTLIESANLLGLLTSINAHQRERVSDALVAGPPQPEQPKQPQVLSPVKTGR